MTIGSKPSVPPVQMADSSPVAMPPAVGCTSTLRPAFSLSTLEMADEMTWLSEPGGSLLRANDPAHLRERFIEVLREMRSRYVLTFTPSAQNEPGWHALSVKLRTRRGRVAARAGYAVPDARF